MTSGASRGPGVDNQTWLIDVGHDIIEKKRGQGQEALTPRERLIRALWVVDYSMRNAGDLATARDLDPGYLVEGAQAAALLALPLASAMFGLSEGELERRFFDLFEPVCSELRTR
jgi:hypothetical protein